jgi:predicted AAA+ superfamily ATPase
MNRDLLSTLKSWKADSRRKPLILRGARQVGKTWLIEFFGKNEYKHFFTINFELQPHFKSCFEIPDPDEIITRVELTANASLAGDETLLFLDEIQQCPEALTSLRYFYEKKPGLSVIAAGSLLEFIGQSEKLSVPVGRILTYRLAPLSFGEFLTACQENLQ